jgi:hypothetical protein
MGLWMLGNTFAFESEMYTINDENPCNIHRGKHISEDNIYKRKQNTLIIFFMDASKLKCLSNVAYEIYKSPTRKKRRKVGNVKR